jgi:ubiquinone/menaquinone biosynthesis C-methylase UbiE
MDRSREEKSASLFNEWAQSGRGVSMAEGHGELVDFALSSWQLDESHRLLDIGCGVGQAARRALNEGAGRVAGIDVASDMIAIAKDGLPEGDFQLGSGDALPWEENSFSHVLSIESLYYHTDPVKTLGEACRVLEPGGRTGMAIEFYKDNIGSRYWGQALDFPMHNWSEQEWRTAFIQAGFREITSSRIRRQGDDVTAVSFQPSPYFPSYDDYRAYIDAGALWVEGVR